MHEAEGDRFIEAGPAEDRRNPFIDFVAEARFPFRNRGCRTGGRNVFIAVDTSYFFSDIGHFRAVAAIAGNDSRKIGSVFFDAKLEAFQ